MTVCLPAATKDQLAVLAEQTRRTSSFLEAEAITDYVAREPAIVAGIERDHAEVCAGQVTPHDEVAADAREIIEAARTGR